MRSIKVWLMFCCLSALSFHSLAQTDTTESIESQVIKEVTKKNQKRAGSQNNAVLISPYYTALFPIGELSNRFGFCNNVGLNISFKVRKNFLIGVEGSYIFGTRVKEDPLIQISTASTGQLINQNNSLGDIPLQMSGFDIALRVGHLFAFSKKHPNSGIILSLAPGFLQHKIWIHANTNIYPQLDDTYKKGYDRMTNGAMVGASLGYMYLEKRRFLSFYGGLDFKMAFTQERRNWNFDLMSADTHQRIDMFLGIRLAWIIPVFTNKNSDINY
jgi:hypothetical protein